MLESCIRSTPSCNEHYSFDNLKCNKEDDSVVTNQHKFNYNVETPTSVYEKVVGELHESKMMQFEVRKD